MALDLSQFQNLDPNNIGNWPPAPKAAVIALACVVVLGLGYWLDTKNQREELERLEQTEEKLKKEFETKQAKAANLEAYRQQMAEMQESFGTMLRQLPSKTEVADLLVDVTQTGLASNLEFELFKPGNEIPKDFYAELPIEISVNGTYHSFGEFVGGVAALPRIVTIHNVNIAAADKKSMDKKTAEQQSADALVMKAVARTYRYLDEEEIAAARKAEAEKQKAKRKK